MRRRGKKKAPSLPGCWAERGAGGNWVGRLGHGACEGKGAAGTFKELPWRRNCFFLSRPLARRRQELPANALAGTPRPWAPVAHGTPSLRWHPNKSGHPVHLAGCCTPVWGTLCPWQIIAPR